MLFVAAYKASDMAAEMQMKMMHTPKYLTFDSLDFGIGKADKESNSVTKCI